MEVADHREVLGAATFAHADIVSAGTRPRRAVRVYRIYVVELADAAAPRRPPGQASVYVGQTVVTPEERFAQHKAGHKASRVVRRHGVRLRPDLYEGLPLLASREAALVLEARVAAELRSRGFRVFGGH
jgi:predicted GIY-YIG superfamily endonuclease